MVRVFLPIPEGATDVFAAGARRRKRPPSGRVEAIPSATMATVAILFLASAIVAAFARRWGLCATFAILALACGFFSI